MCLKGEHKSVTQTIFIKFINGKFKIEPEELPPGKIVLEFENLTDKKGSIIILNLAEDHPKLPVQFDPFLSGKRLLCTQIFRELFRSETIQGTEGIGVKDITILFTDLKGSTALYERIGDLKAFSLIRQHFDSLGKVVNGYKGAIVKTIGDAVMATFLNPLDGINSALEMLKEIEYFNQEQGSEDLILKGTSIQEVLLL